ncbi:MAG: pyruvate kinase [Candidatus Altimarinota bacterium]
MKKTKIIATVGPVTQSKEQLEKMYHSGVNIVRFNFSHATFDVAKPIADTIKELNKEGKTQLSLLLDTKGPEIRTGIVEKKIELIAGNNVKIVVDDAKRGEDDIFCDYEYLLEDIKVGETIIIDSGLCNVRVKEIHNDFLIGEVLNTCIIGSKRHINLPGVKLKLPGITSKDKEDVLFAIENDYDFIAMSFVRNKENIQELRDILKEYSATHIKIISKIENQEAIENLEEIIQHSDGVMVARGDLGIEVPIEKLPFYQKEIAKLCLKYGKFFIIATHLLETMIENPFPTRAEVSDIYNSVMASADCTMLSGETTTGKYPIESIQMMAKVIIETEKGVQNIHNEFSNNGLNTRDIEKKSLIKHAISIAEELDAKAIIILTKTGLLARLAAAFRPNIDVYAFTKTTKSLNFMNILYGIKPKMLESWNDDYMNNVEGAIEKLKKENNIIAGDKVIAVSDIQKHGKEFPIIEIIEVE